MKKGYLLSSGLGILLAGMVLFYTACTHSDPNQEIDEGKITANTYHSDQIGWTMEIPEGWEIVKRETVAENTKKGKKAVEEVIGEYDFSNVKYLLNFRKNAYNVFQATSEPFDTSGGMNWKINNKNLKDVIYETYAKQGMQIDTSSATSNIDGLNFEVYIVTLYGPDGDEILRQEMYSRLINGFDFGVVLNYNNPEDRAEMMDAWKNSKFNSVD